MGVARFTEMEPNSYFSVDIPSDVREHWEKRFSELEPQLNGIVDQVADSYDDEVQACRTQAKSIAAETAAIDEARYAREVENGVSGPLDKEFAEMVLLRDERRQLQRQRIAEDGLVYGRLHSESSYRDLELRATDPRLRHLGPDMGEEAINMRLAHIDHMHQQAAAHLDHPLRAYSAQSRIQTELDHTRERVDSQRWLRQLAPEHWNRRASQPVHAVELNRNNIRGLQDLQASQSHRQLYRGVSKTDQFSKVTNDMVRKGKFAQGATMRVAEDNFRERSEMLHVQPLQRAEDCS